MARLQNSKREQFSKSSNNSTRKESAQNPHESESESELNLEKETRSSLKNGIFDTMPGDLERGDAAVEQKDIFQTVSSVENLSSPLLQFHFLTLFPEVFSPVLNSSLLGKAQKKGLVSYSFTQIRDFSQDKHRTVDDTPYGGGEGMLLRADVLYSAWKSIVGESSLSSKEESGQEFTKQKPKVATVLLSPQGELFTQKMAKELSEYSKLIFVCGHYEGVDERFIDLCVDREVSIGDYVLTGGELPAMVMAETISRLLPGVVGNDRSLSQDSLENNLLKYPQYTRPKEFMGLSVPEVLLSGNHGAIREWREQQMRERTQKKRPDLLKKEV